MRSLFLTAPCLIVIFTTGLIVRRTPMNIGELTPGLYTGDSHSESNPHYRNTAGTTYCVFVIDIDLRNTQDDVENNLNWRYLGNIADNIPSCGPGVLQACQLIVDERDTEVSKDGIRVLKPDVVISARLNKQADVWYVSRYTPIGSTFYEVLNEEDDQD